MNILQLKKKLVELASRWNSITAVTIGNNPEDANLRTYYFVTKGPYDEKRADEISEFEIRDFNNVRLGFLLAEWPSGDLRKYPFLWKIIWAREKRSDVSVN